MRNEENMQSQYDRGYWYLFLAYLISWPLFAIFFEYLFQPVVLLALFIIAVILVLLAVRSYLREV